MPLWNIIFVIDLKDHSDSTDLGIVSTNWPTAGEPPTQHVEFFVEWRKKRPRQMPRPESGADHALRNLCHIGSLWTFLTLNDLELDSVAFGERFETTT